MQFTQTAFLPKACTRIFYMLKPVIMAGGSGSRLWPLSRGNYPKQFLALHGESTMLQQTILRLQGLSYSPPLLICNEEHRFIAAEQLRQLQITNGTILLEPVGRNTAPAIALASIQSQQQGEDPILLVLAADHVIRDAAAFRSAVQHAQPYAEQGKLVTFGIVPTHAETGYGYIRRGQQTKPTAASPELTDAYYVGAFVEKPNLTTATNYLESGDYYWNSGMFMCRASVYLTQLQQFRPDILQCCQAALAQQTPDLDFIRITESAFIACPDDSVDYAIMEPLTAKQPDAVVVVPLDAGWNDVGGFAALWQVDDKDSAGNVLHGDVISHQSQNCYVRSEQQLVATVGVQDLVVISTKDAVLVAHKDQAQEVKAIVQQLKAKGRAEATYHREVYRPWGKYDSVDQGERFQVKRITVKPGAKLSVQMHHHRAEHWIVVSGTAKVTIDGQDQYLTENQSVYIPITAVHALENPGKVPLELIEVQSGSYLGEDDIVRFSDRYGRS
jgi:mannose-1-phosphate guanylyltransferase